ncbi:MAG: hypothetical protein FRX49_07554 [Trebouxia sp. A1-2]|nr:MAG: hypothetical protein FRX49_07554 [Trebouxia sp. A1-2]
MRRSSGVEEEGARGSAVTELASVDTDSTGITNVDCKSGSFNPMVMAVLLCEDDVDNAWVTEALCHKGFLQHQPSAVPGTQSVVTELVPLRSQMLLHELALVLLAVLVLQGHCWALAGAGIAVWAVNGASAAAVEAVGVAVTARAARLRMGCELLQAAVKHLYDAAHTAILQHEHCVGQPQPQQESYMWQYDAQRMLVAAES